MAISDSTFSYTLSYSTFKHIEFKGWFEALHTSTDIRMYNSEGENAGQN